MKKLRASLVFLFSLLSMAGSAQFIVSGRIVDSASREPLGGASVFCQNTTIGTASDKQGEFSLPLKSGGYDLVISFTGYQTRQLKISHSDGRLPDIELVKEEKSLGEVIVKNSYEVPDGWIKYGDFFLEHFIGSTPFAAKCTLKNPEVLKFYFLRRSNKLRVLAMDALQIENGALGYTVRYQMDSFVYHYNTDINLYRGYALYSEMEGSDSLRRVWEFNRRNAYYGSKLHFMRSYYDSVLLEEGFMVDLVREDDPTKFTRIENVYDSSYYSPLDSTGQIEIWFPRKFSVTYARRKPEPEYLKKFKLPKDVPIQTSYIDVTNGIAITENGYFYDQKDWINQGYWSWKNLADQLPYDYFP